MSKKYKLIFAPFLIVIFFFSAAFVTDKSVQKNPVEKPPEDQIENYQSLFGAVTDKSNKSYVAIRSYQFKGSNYFLVVDPDTLKTFKKVSTEVTLNPSPELVKKLSGSKYFSMLRQYNSAPFINANYGIKHKASNNAGVYLTIDMCPSKRPFEKEFFDKLIYLSEKNQEPTPIAIAISGMWILRHEEEFGWITDHKKNLEITWINHSFSHPYDPNAPLLSNFLLSPNLDIKNEILRTEQLLIERGETPSIFFRFPGLISDKNLINTIIKYGLIPIGSDAWLAKGEQPKNGSIILVHGNSNEHKGIEMMMKILDDDELDFLPIN